MFLSRNKKNNLYPYKTQFYYIKVGFKGVNIISACFCDEMHLNKQKTQYHVGKHNKLSLQTLITVLTGNIHVKVQQIFNPCPAE